MSEHKLNINFINRVLNRKEFQYKGDFYQYVSSRDEDKIFEFKYRVKKIEDIKMMIHAGEWRPSIFLGVEFFDLNEYSDKTFRNILKMLGDINISEFFKIMAGTNLQKINREIYDYLKRSIGFDGSVQIIDYDIQFKESINEGKTHRLPIKDIIKDIVKILKTEGEGRYHLPEDISDKMVYNFKRVKNISVELEIREDEGIEGFAVNGNYMKDEDVIEVLIVINPNKSLNRMMYDIIGELNDLIAHELEHYKQYTTGEYDLGDEDEDDDALTYYTKPHEISAQIKGFKRLSRIRRIPLEITIRNWFATHKDIHHLNKNDEEKVIKILLQNV